MITSPSAQNSEYVGFNGTVIPSNEALVPATAPGTRFGIGCFETMRLYDGEIRFLRDHLDRLQRACQALELPEPPSGDEILALGLEVARKNNLTNGMVRFSLHLRHPGTADAVLTTAPPRPIFQRSTLRLRQFPLPHPGPSPITVHKHNNYAFQLHAFEAARATGADDALLTDPSGRPVETAISNLYVRNGRTLYSPGPESGALPGIIRLQVLRVARACGLEVIEGPADVNIARAADAIWVSNALIGLRPVESWDDQIWNAPLNDPFLKSIREASNLVEAY